MAASSSSETVDSDRSWVARTIRRADTQRTCAAEGTIDAWDAAELPDLTPLAEWVGKEAERITASAGAAAVQAINIPEERPAELSPSPMFDPNAVHFGRRASSKGRAATEQNAARAEGGTSHHPHDATHVDCTSLAQARLIVRLANVGVSGWVNVPTDVLPAGTPVPQCLELLRAVDARLQAARKRFDELAESRTSDPRLQAQIVELVLGWFVHGRGGRETTTDAVVNSGSRFIVS